MPNTYDHLWISDRWFGSDLSADLGWPVVFAGHSSLDTRQVSVAVPGPDEDAVARGVADALVWLHESVREPGVRTGFVHVDSIADPYSKKICERSRLARNDLRREVHGYFWVVALSELHIERLGGAEAVVRDSPCAQVERIAAGDGEALLCKLTESPLEMTEELVREWRSYLAPLLRAGFPYRHPVSNPRPAGREPTMWLYEGDFVPVHGDELLYESLPRVPLAKQPPQFAFDLSDTTGSGKEITQFSMTASRPLSHAEVTTLQSVVNAWSVAGIHGHLAESGRILSCGLPQVAGGDPKALEWTVKSEDLDMTTAASRLGVVILSVLGQLGWHLFERLAASNEMATAQQAREEDGG